MTLNALVGKSLLWFIEADVTLDYPRPTMPNEILIGGLNAKPAKPLPGEWVLLWTKGPLHDTKSQIVDGHVPFLFCFLVCACVCVCVCACV